MSRAVKFQELVLRIQIIHGMFLHLTIMTFLQFPVALLHFLKYTMGSRFLNLKASGCGRKFQLHFQSHLKRSAPY
uniref:Uncharacterized protein n=1 Tax=Arundo donax TaxID=35708 RepID=A0A0A8Y8Q7_ARUDO